MKGHAVDHTTQTADQPQHQPTDRLRNYPYEAQERAAIYEFEAGMTRKDAEERVIREMEGLADR